MSKKTETSVVMAPDPNPKPSLSKPLTGSNYEKFGSILMGQLGNTLWTAHSTATERQTQLEVCLEAMAGIGPQDETEGMLAAQMVALHSAAMECFRRAMLNDQPLQNRQLNLNFATKLTRTYALHKRPAIHGNIRTHRSDSFLSGERVIFITYMMACWPDCSFRHN